MCEERDREKDRHQRKHNQISPIALPGVLIRTMDDFIFFFPMIDFRCFLFHCILPLSLSLAASRAMGSSRFAIFAALLLDSSTSSSSSSPLE